MLTAFKCPRCAKLFVVGDKFATRKVKCPQCFHRFLPVVDSEVICPDCGAIVIMPCRPEQLRKASCIACGYVFPRARRYLIFKPITGAVRYALAFTRRTQDFVSHKAKELALLAAIAAAVAVLITAAVIEIESHTEGASSPAMRQTVSIPQAAKPDPARNEQAAIAALKAIRTAQKRYVKKYYGYGTLKQLSQKTMIDHDLAIATSRVSPKDGYCFFIWLRGNISWACTARPAKWGVTGAKNFQIRTDGRIYYNTEKNSSEFTKKLGE